MTRPGRAALCVLLLAASVLTAQAQERPAGGDWTGLYVGGQLALGAVDGDGFDGSGPHAGAHVGYLYSLGPVVAGAELEFDWAKIDLDGAADELDRALRLKLVAGVEAGGGLVYATGGMARADIVIGGETFQGHGHVYGLGVAYPMANGLVLGGEVLRNDFDNFDGTGIGVSATMVSGRLSLQF